MENKPGNLIEPDFNELKIEYIMTNEELRDAIRQTIDSLQPPVSSPFGVVSPLPAEVIDRLTAHLCDLLDVELARAGACIDLFSNNPVDKE